MLDTSLPLRTQCSQEFFNVQKPRSRVLMIARLVWKHKGSFCMEKRPSASQKSKFPGRWAHGPDLACQSDRTTMNAMLRKIRLTMNATWQNSCPSHYQKPGTKEAMWRVPLLDRKKKVLQTMSRWDGKHFTKPEWCNTYGNLYDGSVSLDSKSKILGMSWDVGGLRFALSIERCSR